MKTTTDVPLYRALDEPPYVVADLDRQLRAIEDVATVDRLIENERAKHNRKTVIDRAEARRRALERDETRVESVEAVSAATHPKEAQTVKTAVIEKDPNGRSVAVDEATGEILGEIQDVPKAVTRYQPPTPASMSAFLSEIVSDEALAAQTKLSEAYDRYCRALLSPNDVQKADGKEFKKKSAWRKLGRAFQVSTEIRRHAAQWEDDPSLPEGYRHFTAEYEVRATAPWGQYAEAVGACSTREGRFWISGVACPECGGPTWDNREPKGGYPEKHAWKAKLPPFTCRVKECGGFVDDPDASSERRPNPNLWGKAEHDVRGTAETRATNRAISNLIAAGEVSAEEVDGGGDDHPAPADRMGDKEPEGHPSPPAAKKEPMSQVQYDEIAGLLDSRDFEGQAKRLDWCEGIVRGEIKPSYDTATKAIADLKDMPLRGEADDGDDLPF